ncbi:MAG: hypothetical protein HOP18_02690 [Deltaproteobacteria bacterium]|nr:hypothetical protein [Deltaproteobacteria bacterium]
MRIPLTKAAMYCGVIISVASMVWYVSVSPKMPEDRSPIAAKEEAKESTLESAHEDAPIVSKKETEPQEGKTEEKVDSLRSEVASQRHTLKTLEERTAFSPDGIAVTDAPPLSEEELEQQAKAEIARHVALYARVAKQEGIDHTWASSAQQAISQSLGELSAKGLGAVDVKCHRSLCEARFFFDVAAPTSALQNLQSFSPWPGEVLIVADTEKGEGRLYLAREGNNLPHP